MKIVIIGWIVFLFLFLSCNRPGGLYELSVEDSDIYEASWYNQAPLRFIQTNLNEKDALMDVDKYIKSIIDANANMIVFNVGGIRAFYPTELPFHLRNPYLNGDLVSEVLEKCRNNGIRFVARFDMSKINESIASQKPEWLYVGMHGKNVNYNGEVHTCINGGYQQEYVFEILKEAISRYPFDAVFFNMGGYTTSDYSQVNHGICQCENCRRRFRDSTGLALPVRPDNNDPVYRKYREFQSSTTTELDLRVKEFIKSLDPDIVFQHREGEMVRSESGTAFTSGSDWNYHATENVKRILNSHKNQVPNDTYNYLMGMDYRHTATSPNIGRIYLAEQMLNGGGPGIYFIGRIETQPDRVFLNEMREIYGFHKTNEKLFTNVRSLARVGLIMGAAQEFRGIMKMLIEEHIMYDLIQPRALVNDRIPRKLEEYDALIISNITEMDKSLTSIINNYVAQGGKLIVTGFTGLDDRNNVSGNKTWLDLIGIQPEFELLTQPRSTYLMLTENDRIDLGRKEFEDFDLIMMNSRFAKCQTTENAKGYLRLLPNTMHGPPEKCYFTDDEVTGFPGLIYNEFGNGRVVFIPWLIGSQYSWKGNNGQRTLFLAALRNLLDVESQLITNASPLIEMTHLGNLDGVFEWLGLINHSGQIGDVFREPVTICNTAISFKPSKPVKSVHLVRSGERLKFKTKGERIEFVVPELDDFEMVLCLYR